MCKLRIDIIKMLNDGWQISKRKIRTSDSAMNIMSSIMDTFNFEIPDLKKYIYSREIDIWQSNMIPYLVVFLFAAVDKFCLYLTSSVGKRGSYINAISVSVSYTSVVFKSFLPKENC